MQSERAPNTQSDEETDLVWGAEAIGRVIGRTAKQTYHLLRTGALDGAVARVANRTFVGSRRALRNLPFTARAATK